MSLKRRSYEAGHKPKFLVIIDESPECDRAVYYASRRAARTGASVVMLLVIEPHDRHQQWLGVADIMKAEAHEAADQKLDEFAARANGVAGITPERVIRDGEKSEQILKLIDEDEDIAILVLAAGTGKEGPGRWSRASARPRAAIRSRSRSCPGTWATRTSTRCRRGAWSRTSEAALTLRPARKDHAIALEWPLTGRKGPSIAVTADDGPEKPCSSRPKRRPIPRP